MDKDIKSALTQGLIIGYAGKQHFPIDRAGNSGMASDVERENFRYHDEWFSENRLGGGQELVNVREKRYMRLYAGGIPANDVLQVLNITTHEINSYLKRKIIELEERTRLDENCLPDTDEEWKYEYRVQGQEGEVVVGYEKIFYQDIQVHFHAFLICPIK